MVTVIATGFDGGRKRHTSAREATGVMDTSASIRQPRERDFLEELQRQRDEVADAPSYPTQTPSATPLDDDAAAAVAVPAAARSVGESQPAKRPATTYDADDLEIPSFLRRQ